MTFPADVGRRGPWRGVIEEFRDRLLLPDDATAEELAAGRESCRTSCI